MGSKPSTPGRIAGKTVYIIGSGFSAPLGIPTIKNFIQEGLRLLKELKRPEEEQCVDEVLKMLAIYDNILMRGTSSAPTLEDYFCAIDAKNDVTRQVKNQEGSHRECLVKFVRKVIDAAEQRHDQCVQNLEEQGGRIEAASCPVPVVPRRCLGLHNYQEDMPRAYRWTHHREPVACPYQAFWTQVIIECQRAGRASDDPWRRPAIITLNYDLVLEKKLRSLNSSWRYVYHTRSSSPPRNGRTIPLIKLHGSLNWKGDPKAIDTQATSVRETVPLIMPSWVREQMRGTRFEKLTKLAISHLKCAERIVVLGYSMPRTDNAFRYIVAQGLQTTEAPLIEIYCRMKASDATARARDMFGANAAVKEPVDGDDLFKYLERSGL